MKAYEPGARPILLSTAALLLVASSLAGCAPEVPERTRRTQATPAANDGPRRDPAGKRILLVHSYHPEYPWVAAITAGVQHELAGSGTHLEIFYMDTKLRTSEAWKQEAGRLARQRLAAFNPDVVITADDNAQQYFAQELAGDNLGDNLGRSPSDYPSGSPGDNLGIVFCGVNADPSLYGFPAPNATGIIERPHFIQTLGLARRLGPIQRIAMLSCDDETSRGAFSAMKQTDLDVEVVEWLLTNSFPQWQDAVLRWNGTVDAIGIYMYHTLHDTTTGVSMDPGQVVSWTSQVATVPTLGFFDFAIENGLLIGQVESGFEHGQRAAHYALEILRGRSPGSLPVRRADVGILMVNKTTARRLGITLPADLLAEGEPVGQRLAQGEPAGQRLAEREPSAQRLPEGEPVGQRLAEGQRHGEE